MNRRLMDERAQLLVGYLKLGAGTWITEQTAGYWIAAIEGEWDRVVLWRERVNPVTGRRYSWLGAARIVAENPPSFDRAWAEAFESGVFDG